MEKDIEILEEILNRQIEDIEGTKIVYKAIENLINRVKELEKIVEAYNVIPNDYIPKDMKIVIADREYFNNGILKETCLPKSKIKEKIEELRKEMLNDIDDIQVLYQRHFCKTVLQELLEEEK